MINLTATSGATSQALAIGTASAASVAFKDEYVYIYSTINCFMRQGTAPVAAADTDQFIPATTLVRVRLGKGATAKLAFIAAAGGTVYLTPGA